MKLKEILEYHLIETDKFDLTVYHLLTIFIIFIIARLILWVIKRLFRRQEKANKLDKGKSHSIYAIIKYTIWVIAIAIMLDTIGIKVTILIASSAALLVGLGLGLQQIFQDFVSGFTLLIEGTLQIEDIVEMEDGEVGRVIEIGIRTSKLETRDHIILIVPNSKLVNNQIINWSHLEKRTRFSVAIGVAYGSDIEKVKLTLLGCADRHERIAKTPSPIVRFTDFGNSSLNFELLFWTTETFRVEDVKSDIRFMIDAEFRKNNITIPFPQRDIHIKTKM
jgi:small-conductance mechanosensitive channel